MAIGFCALTNVSPGSYSSWVDLDLSAHVASGATGAILRIVNTSAGVNKAIGARKNGSTDARTDVLRFLGQTQAYVGLDGSRICEVYIEDASVVVYVEGYFDSDVVFFDNGVSKAPSGGFTWTTTSIASDTGGDTSIAAIIEYVGASLGLRKTGSTDTVRGFPLNHCWCIVGVDGSEQFDLLTNSAAVVGYLVGYVKAGGMFSTNATDRSPASSGSYGDLAAFTAGYGAGLYMAIGTGSEQSLALRKKGDSADLYYKPGGDSLGWFIVEGDASRVVEAKISGTSMDVWETGAFSLVAPPPTPTGRGLLLGVG